MPIRYSPKPVDAYNKTLENGMAVGPGAAVFLRSDPEAWNLAWLSHDYEQKAEHPDGDFTVLVRRSVNTVLGTGEVDVLGMMPASATVRSLLQLPAERFLIEITTRTVNVDGEKVPLLQRLPLFVAYGVEWLERAKERAGNCVAEEVAELPADQMVPRFDQAALLIDKLRRQ